MSLSYRLETPKIPILSYNVIQLWENNLEIYVLVLLTT